MSRKIPITVPAHLLRVSRPHDPEVAKRAEAEATSKAAKRKVVPRKKTEE